jgi:hypothetical protein
MARYRIENDMTILWSINDRNGAALPLNDKEVHLYYTCERGRYEADIEIQDGNVVIWHFYGRQQRTLGDYTLTLEILQSNGKRSIKKDMCKAFTLVSKECEEKYGKGEAHINEGGEVTLVTDLDIYRISPVIPYVGEDGYWWVDDQKTPWYSRGPKGEVTDVAYLDFEIDDEMNLNLTFISGNEDMNLKFTLGEDGQLTLDN